MSKKYKVLLILVVISFVIMTGIFLSLKWQQGTNPQYKQADLHSIQFENYKWGTSWNEMRGWAIIEKDVMSRYHKILNESCLVRLIFTPKSRLLAKVELFWDMPKATNFKDKLKTLLTKKYGLPYKSEFEKMYIWMGSSTTLLLDCEDFFNPSRVELIYSSKKYEKMREREIQKKILEEAGEEIDRF